MKQASQKITLPLDRSGIDSISESVRGFLSAHEIESREISRCTLAVEEILLNHLDTLSGEAVSVSVTMGIRLRTPSVTLEVSGAPFNTYAMKAEEQGVLGNSVLRRLGITPEYAYRNSTNAYTFRFQKKRLNPFVTLLIALAAAGLIGGLGRFLPEAFRTDILNDVLDPLHGTFLNMLSCLASPMVFLTVAWGIYGIGDAATLKRIGKKMLLHYTETVYLCLLVGVLVLLPFFRVVSVGESGASGFAAIFRMLLGMIPKNILSPFVDGNTLQIIFMAVLFGIAMLFLGRKTDAVAKAVEQISYIIQFLIEFIGKLVPFFISIVLIGMIWSDSLAILGNLRKLFLLFLLSVLIAQSGVLLWTAIKNHVSPLLLFLKGLPTLIIALTTASSAAAFGSNIRACRDEYGIDEKLTSFGLPLGMVMHKPFTSLYYLVMVLFFAEMFGVDISLSWIVMAVLSAGILAIATPPIPGGSITAYTVLFTQLGIPAEAIAIALTCDALFDFVETGFDQFSLPLGLLNQAGGFGMLDRKALLRKPKNPSD